MPPAALPARAPAPRLGPPSPKLSAPGTPSPPCRNQLPLPRSPAPDRGWDRNRGVGKNGLMSRQRGLLLLVTTAIVFLRWALYGVSSRCDCGALTRGYTADCGPDSSLTCTP